MLVGGPLDLHAGSIYVDAQSSIHDDGRNGDFQGQGCPPDGLGDPNLGANSAQRLNLVAMVVEIDGQVTANGGQGLSSRVSTAACQSNFRAVSGGRGGTIVGLAGTMRLNGTLWGQGGNGGSGKAYGNVGGFGGDGGQIEIGTFYPLPTSARAHLHVEAGMGGAGATPQKRGFNGHMGDVFLFTLSPDAFNTLPQPTP
jgi:hypothetical protein